MDVKLVVAIISGAVTLVAAAISVWANVRVTRIKHELDRESRQDDRDFEARTVLDQYRRPLLAGAVELARRIGNIRGGGFLVYLSDEDRRAEVALQSTLYRFATYLAWREVLYRKLTYLHYGDTDRTKEAVAALEHVSTQMASSSLRENDGRRRLMLWKDEQRAIGGLMLSPEDALSPVCGFETFAGTYTSTFETWLGSFAEDLRSPGIENSPRLAAIEGALEKLVEILDEENVYQGNQEAVPASSSRPRSV